MDQLFDNVANFNLPFSEEMSYQDLPLISSNEIDGILAVLENQPPIAPFDEVKNIAPHKNIILFTSRCAALILENLNG